MHEHPRLAALSGLAETAAPFSLEKSDCFAPPSLRGPAQGFSGVLSGADQYLPREASAEEPGEFLTSSANVPDKPAEPLRHHKGSPKPLADIEMVTKVMKWRCSQSGPARDAALRS